MERGQLFPAIRPLSLLANIVMASVVHPVGIEHGTKALLGIDVGTGSARAAIFDTDGRLLGLAKQSIRTWYEAGGQVEQSSRDIWAAVQTSVRRALTDAGM